MITQFAQVWICAGTGSDLFDEDLKQSSNLGHDLERTYHSKAQIVADEEGAQEPSVLVCEGRAPEVVDDRIGFAEEAD